MTKLFAFISVCLISAHLKSCCGLLAVFEGDACVDDVALAGCLLSFYVGSGPDYRFEFKPHSLFMYLAMRVIAASFVDNWIFGELSKKSVHNLPAQVSLCYNAVTMQFEFCFANNNNNNDNDDPKIVGRSFAG